MLKLHLGCGDKHLDGFINVDARALPGVDIVADMRNVWKTENAIDLIYCSHVLEHIGRREYMDVLKEWFMVLREGGVLRLAVPDIEKCLEHYAKCHDLRILRGFFWGGQTYEGNTHYCGWDFNTLRQDLEEVGFRSVSRYDWRKTEHANIDDFSQCYLPHMDKENGMLMSLNVEAIK